MKPTTQLNLDLIPIPKPEPKFVLITDAPKGQAISRGMELLNFRKKEDYLKKMTNLYHFYRPEKD